MFIDFLCISLYLYILDIICENPISAIGISPKPQGFHQGNPWMATVSFVLPAAAPLHRSVEMEPTKRRNDETTVDSERRRIWTPSSLGRMMQNDAYPLVIQHGLLTNPSDDFPNYKPPLGMSHPFKLLCNQQAGNIREVFSTKNIWLKMIYGFLKIQARMIHVVHWCSIFEPCVLVAGSFYQ